MYSNTIEQTQLAIFLFCQPCRSEVALLRLQQNWHASLPENIFSRNEVDGL
jgi:hypothetical protein